MKIKFTALALALLLPAAALAQPPAMELDYKICELGSLPADNAFVLCGFGLCNASATDTIVISRIEAPCPIEVISYPDTLAPDMADRIELRLNTETLTGSFIKNIYVYGGFDTFYLSVKGMKRTAVGTDQTHEEQLAPDDEEEEPVIEKKKKRKRKKT